jgi:hypothetical protein
MLVVFFKCVKMSKFCTCFTTLNITHEKKIFWLFDLYRNDEEVHVCLPNNDVNLVA